MKLTIRTKHLNALLNLTSDNDVRFCLNGIKIEADATHVRLIATTGTVLGVVRVDRLEDEDDDRSPIELIIPRSAVSAVLKAEARAISVALTRVSETEYRLGSVFFNPIDGTYPDWRRIMPKRDALPDAVPSTFDPELLMLFHKAEKSLKSKNGFFRLIHGEKDSVAGVVFPSNPEFAGVIMPIRCEKVVGDFPEWAFKGE